MILASGWDTEKMLYVSGRKRRKKPGRPCKAKAACTVAVGGRHEEAVKKRERLSGLLASGVPKKQALTMAGYKSERALSDPRVKESVSQMRERLQGATGCTIKDSVDFYKRISEDAGQETSDRLRARSRMDRLLDYEAAKKVEVSETRELSMAIGILSNLPVNPAELVKLVSCSNGDMDV